MVHDGHVCTWAWAWAWWAWWAWRMMHHAAGMTHDHHGWTSMSSLQMHACMHASWWGHMSASSMAMHASAWHRAMHRSPSRDKHKLEFRIIVTTTTTVITICSVNPFSAEILKGRRKFVQHLSARAHLFLRNFWNLVRTLNSSKTRPIWWNLRHLSRIRPHRKPVLLKF
jgi:hypothetical protein